MNEGRRKRKGEEAEEVHSELMARGLQLEAEMDPKGASSVYSTALEVKPDSVDALLHLSKSTSDESCLTTCSWDEARDLVRKANVMAKQAQDMAPEDARTHVAEAMNLGRLAMYSGT